MNKAKHSSLSTLGGFMKPYRGLFVLMMLCELGISGLSIISPLFQSYAIDNFIARNSLDGLTPFIIAYCAVILVSSALQFIETRNGMNLEMTLMRDMRRATFNHLQTLSVAFFNITPVGTLHARVMSDTESIGSIIVWDGNHGLRHLVYVTGAIAVMFALDALLTLCVLAIVPVTALVSVYFERKQTKLNRSVREINSRITGAFNEGITGVATTKTLAAEEKLLGKCTAS